MTKLKIIVFPAQAGVIPIGDFVKPDWFGFPRASGGDPIMSGQLAVVIKFSPRKRG